MNIRTLLGSIALAVGLTTSPGLSVAGTSDNLSDEITDYTDGINGTEMMTLVSAALKDQEISLSPVIAASRRFPACDTEPQVTPRDASWSSVNVRCVAPKIWQRSVRTTVPPRYQPAHTNTDVQTVGEDAVFLTKSLAKGAVITAQDIRLQPVGAAPAPGLFLNPNAVIGRKLKVNLGTGRLVQARHLELAWLVNKGHPVAILFGGNGTLAISAPGEALENGQLGDLIEVRNRASGRIIRAILVARNKVEVTVKMN